MSKSNSFKRNAERHRFIKQIQLASNVKTAVEIRDEMQQKGFNINHKIYFELMIKCSELEDIITLKKEMENQNISLSEEIYILMMKRENSFQNRLALLEEMELNNMSPTIKTYYSLMKIEESSIKIKYIFNRMKSNHIEPDGGVYQLLHNKFLGSIEYDSIKNEIQQYESTKSFILKFLSCKNFADSILLLTDENRLTDFTIINKLLKRIVKFNDRIELLQLSLEAGLEINHHLYWNLLMGAAKEGIAEENKTALNVIMHSLDDAEMLKLQEKFVTHFGKSGGQGKFKIQQFKEEEVIMKEAKHTDGPISYFYLLGKAIGLTMPDSEMQEELIHIEELKTWEDGELLEYELSKSEGIMEGIELKEKIRSFSLSQHTPLILIIHAEDIETTSPLYNYAVTQGLYPYEYKEINHLNLCGCYFTNSVESLQKAIEIIDFDFYDVSVNIFSQEGNIQFYENHPFSENWLYTSFPRTKALMPQFLTLKDGNFKNMNSLFSSLYKPFAIN